jgi:hypothetical protein
MKALWQTLNVRLQQPVDSSVPIVAADSRSDF